MNRSHVGRVPFVLAVMLLVACGEDPVAPEPEPEAQVYALTSVEGAALPVALIRGSDEFTWEAGELTLSADGTCSHSLTSAPVGGVEETVTLDCTYTQDGGDFSYTAAGITYRGSVHGSFTIAIDESDLTFATTGDPARWRTYTRPGR